MPEHLVLLADADVGLDERTRAALAPYGTRILVLDDINETLTQTEVPSLIVLCIDPKRIGWAICNKLKKHPVLRSVPLIVTSAEATAKDFEDHQKLKTRAEEYLLKPYSIDGLVERIRDLLGGLEVQVSGEFELPPADLPEIGEDIVIEDEEAQPTAARTLVEPAAPIALVQADDDPPRERATPAALELAESPHPSLSSETATITLEATSAAGPALALDPADAATEAGEDVALDDGGNAEAVPVPIPGPSATTFREWPPDGEVPTAAPTLTGTSRVPEAEVMAAREEVDALRIERDRLAKEVGELRAARASERSASPERERPPERSGSVNTGAREALQLREVIVQKDRELLALRGQVDAADRAALEIRDRMRETDHGRRDADERLLEVEKKLIEAEERIEGAETERLAAEDRERTLRARIEEEHRRLEQTIAALEVERAAREGAESHLTGLEKDLADHRADTERRLDEKDLAHADLVSALRAKNEQERAALEADLTRTRGDVEDLRGRVEAGDREAAEFGEKLRSADERAVALEAEIAAMKEQAARAVQRLRAEAAAAARTKKALAVAQALLDEGFPSEADEDAAE